MLKESEKLEICKAVAIWITDDPGRSANQLSKRSGVNIRYISSIRNGQTSTRQDDHEIAIKDEYFIKLREIVMENPDEIRLKTDNFTRVQSACEFAHKGKRRVLIDSYDSGQGKTYGLEYYARNNTGVLYVKVTSLMSGRDLIEELVTKLDIVYHRRVSNAQKLRDITDKLIRPGYLIILDEMESVSPAIYRVLKDIEDATKNRCGLVICGLGITNEFKWGAEKRKKLMPQLWRRFRANRVMLRSCTRRDVENGCLEHGITDKGAIKALQELVEDFGTLAEYIKDIKKVLIEGDKPVSQDTVRGLFSI